MCERKGKGVSANLTSLKTKWMSCVYIDIIEMWKGLNLNFLLVKCCYKYKRMGYEPLTSVGSESIYVLVCIYT